MTHIQPSLTTHAAPPLTQATSLLPTARVLNGPLPLTSPSGEDEPYTIKCICGFQDDDGNTVFCEKCETWQHIECYYPAKKVPDVHNCADCEPRPLDPKRATERQKRRREQYDLGDRKTKRPQVKSHKKKPKDSNSTHGVAQTNGYSPTDKANNGSRPDRNSDSLRDQPPAKRPKTSHRNSGSVGSQLDSKNPSLSSEQHRRSRSHQQGGKSPTRSPSDPDDVSNGFHSNLYSQEFIRLHREDPGDSPLKANLLSNINFTSTFSSWIQDPEALREATNGKQPAEVFQRVDRPFEELEVPEITKRVKDDPSVECFGQHPIWQYLTVDSPVLSGGLVGELKGEVGHLRDYWQDPSNRSSLRHPEPFVFFHPQLPIYIDTRREGTRCRYVRRSCHPNVMMRTLISDGVEYHFCLCATTDLKPGTEITMEWVPDPQILNLLNRALSDEDQSGVKSEPLTRAEHDFLSSWTEQVLANFGGCACDTPQDCALARFDRRRASSSDSHSRTANGVKSKKTKKGRQQISPLSTGQAMNSRAGSEAVGSRDLDDDNDDSRSTSGSIRSRPRSRDLTPLTHFSSDMPTASTAPEMSDREKRKIAALERTFEQLEQDNQHQAHKKKKRPSSGSTLNTPGVSSSVRNLTLSPSQSHEADLCRQKQLAFSNTNGSQPTTPEIGHPPENSNGSTSRGTSHSPTLDHQRGVSASPTRQCAPMNSGWDHSAGSSSTSPNNYTSCSVQTEVDGDAWYSEAAPKAQRRTFVPLTKRLLKRCHDDRVRLEEKKHHDVEMRDGPAGTVANATSAVDHLSISAAQSASEVQVSTMPDEPSRDNSIPAIHPIDPNVQKPRPPDVSMSNSDTTSGDTASTIIKPPPTPSTTSTTSIPSDSRPRPNGLRPAELHVQLPPAAQFSTTPSTPSASGTPPSTAGSVAPANFGLNNISNSFSPSVVNSVAQPSPAKKKLSLSDYSRRKKAETPSGDKAHMAVSPNMSHTLLKSSSSVAEVCAAPGSSDESAILDSPAKEEPEPMATASDPALAR